MEPRSRVPRTARLSLEQPRHAALVGGKVRPALQELDCVGIVASAYSPTHVRFRFGSGCQTFHFAVKRGDRYTMSVKGAVKSGVVP